MNKQENILDVLKEKHPRRFKIAQKLVEQLELNGYKNYGNSWQKAFDRKEKTFRLMVDCFEVYAVHHPVHREGWSRYKRKYKKDIFETKNCGMIAL